MVLPVPLSNRSRTQDSFDPDPAWGREVSGRKPSLVPGRTSCIFLRFFPGPPGTTVPIGRGTAGSTVRGLDRRGWPAPVGLPVDRRSTAKRGRRAISIGQRRAHCRAPPARLARRTSSPRLCPRRASRPRVAAIKVLPETHSLAMGREDEPVLPQPEATLRPRAGWKPALPARSRTFGRARFAHEPAGSRRRCCQPPVRLGCSLLCSFPKIDSGPLIFNPSVAKHFQSFTSYV